MAELASPYTPWPKQWIASTVPEDVGHRFYGGQVGGGKSEWLLNEIHEILMRIEARGDADRAIFIRRTFPELQEVIDRSEEIVGLVAEWQESKMRWVYPNGSIFEFGHVFQDKDVRKYKSRQFAAIGMDELTTFSQFVRDYLITRNRSPLEYVIPQFMGASNPGDIGHVHTKYYFVEPPLQDVDRILYRFPIQEFMELWREAVAKIPMRSLSVAREETLPYFYDLVEEHEIGWEVAPEEEARQPQPFECWVPRESDRQRQRNQERELMGLPPIRSIPRVFIPSTLDDNPSLSFDGSYEAGLLQQTDEEIVATTTGDWSISVGQAFPEWSPRKEVQLQDGSITEVDWHVIDPITPPPHWTKWRAIDLGYGAPMSVGWYTINPETKQIIRYRELYRTELTDQEAKRLIYEMSPLPEGFIDLNLGDPKSFSQRSSRDGLTSQEVWADEPFPITVALSNNDRLQGKRRVHNVLAENPLTGRPGFAVTSNCTEFIRCIEQLIRKKDQNTGEFLEDVDDRGEDHIYDEVRYALMGQPTPFYKKNSVKLKVGKLRIQGVYPGQQVRQKIDHPRKGRLMIGATR